MWGELEAALAILAQGKPMEALIHSLRAMTLAGNAHEGWIAKDEVRRVHEKVLKSLANNGTKLA